MSACVKNGTPMTPYLTRFLDVVGARACSMTFEDIGNLGTAPIDYVQLGDINVLRLQGSGHQQSVRQREHIAQDRMEYFLLTMPIRSRYRLRYQGVVTDAPLDSFVFLSTSTPFLASIDELNGRSNFSAAYVRIPGPLLRHQVPRIDELCGRFIPITPGITRAMQASIYAALADGPFMGEAGARVLGSALLNLIGTSAAETLGADVAATKRPTIGEQTLQRAKAFIEANLSNPELGPQEVAAHCHVSTRYLHTLFSSVSPDSSGISCSCYIKELRLLRCREALRHKALEHLSVAEIAANWGFLHLSGFTRLYKKRFGTPPGQDRIRSRLVSKP